MEQTSDSLPAIETLGVAPIPDAYRVMRPGMVFVIWALASASATTPIIGLLLKGIGIGNFVVVIVAATVCGLAPGMVMSEMGRDVPVISMVMARRTFGPWGAAVLTLLYTLVGAGWFGLNTAVGAQILTTLFPTLSGAAFLILGIAQTILVLFGMSVLEKFYKYTAPVFIACYAILAYALFSRYRFSWPHQVGPMSWGADIDLILSFSLLAWAYDFPTVTRFCAPKVPTETLLTRGRYLLAAPLGVMSAVLVMGVLGLFSLKLAGLWNVALLAKSLPVWGEVAALGVILAIAHTNAMNLYPAVTKLLMLLDFVSVPPHRNQQPVSVLALGAFSTYLAYQGILNEVQSFLLILGAFLFPFTFMLAADYWLSRRATRSPLESLEWCHEVPSRHASALVLLIVGLVLAEWPHAFLGSLTRLIPWQLLTAGFVTGLYLVARRFTAGRTVPKTQPILRDD